MKTKKEATAWTAIAEDTGVTAAQAKKIVKLYRDDGLALAPVGEAVDLPVSRVRAVLMAADVPLRPKAGNDIDWSTVEWAGRTFAEIAASLSASLGRDVPRQTVAAAAKRLKIRPSRRPAEPLPTPARDAPLRQIVGWRIAIHQRRLGWTNARIAEEMGGSWNQSSIGVVKHGQTGPGRRGLTLETLQEMAEALGVSPADLLLLPEQVTLAPALDFQGGPAAWAEGEWVRLTGLKRPPLRAVLGVTIARWRCFRGWRQKDLEQRISGRTASNRISDVEGGSPISGHGITLDTLPTFATALEVTPADLARLPRQPALVSVKSG